MLLTSVLRAEVAAAPPAAGPGIPKDASNADQPKPTVSFERQIRPILSEHCFQCHGPDRESRAAELRLDREVDAKRDRDGRLAVHAGHPESSLLIERIVSRDPDTIMPPPSAKRPLRPRQIELLRQWIESGAEYQSHWSFRPIHRPGMPAVVQPGWVRNGVDEFILARMAEHQLRPSVEADRRTLLRRVTLDLTGLPPTPEQSQRFLADDRPGAYERLVDRLLSSPAYGEHMAVAWLDAARYADTSGYQADWERFMWPWRNWVIDAYNAGMPFDQFTVEQLAGDLLPDATPSQVLATGFNRNHRINDEGGVIAAEFAVEYVVDRVDTTSTVWLGLTMGCVRCHDHKYDPFSQNDYYNLFALFNNVPEKGKDGRKGFSLPVLDYPDATVEAELNQLRQQLAALEASNPQATEKLSPDQQSPEEQSADQQSAEESDSSARQQQAQVLREQIKSLSQRQFIKVMVMSEMPEPRQTFVLKRGQYDQPDHERPAIGELPEILGRFAAEEPRNRLSFARWLVSSDNPLTARVVVNREWSRMFGAGLVRTVEDFGSQGAPPTHPQLLDWLASELRDGGWDLKRLHRLLVTSATYRQSSHVTAELLERDPENRWLARSARLRLSAQTIRDQALAASGLLVRRLGGPSVKPYQPPGLWSEVSFQDKKRSTDFFEQDHGEDLYKRSLYTFWKRSVAPPRMMIFDAANRETCVVTNTRTSTPLQALTLLNDVQFVEAARVMATRVLRESRSTATPPLDVAMSLLGLTPRQASLATLRRGHASYLKHFQAQPREADELLTVGEFPVDESLDAVELAAMTMVATVLLNLDQTITRE